MNKPELYEKIEDYIKGRLSVADMQAFENELTNDAELAEEVELHRDMMEVIPDKDVINLRSLMNDSYQKYQENQQQKTTGTWGVLKGGGKMYWAAAASFLLVVSAGLWWINIKEDHTISQVETRLPPVEHPGPTSAPPTANAPMASVEKATNRDYAAMVQSVYKEDTYHPGTLMGKEDAKSGGAGAGSAAGNQTIPDDRLQKATKFYGNKQFSNVTQILKTLPEDGKTEALILRAHSYFQLGRYNNAVPDFQQLTDSFSYQQDAEWYLLLCYAAQLPESKKAFDALFQKVTEPGHPFEKKARILMQKVNRY